MEERIVIRNDTETTESKGTAFGLEGNLFVIPVAGMVVSGLLSAVLMAKGLNMTLAIPVSLLPFALCTAFAYLVNNKPPHFIEDNIEKSLDRRSLGVNSFEPEGGKPMALQTRKFNDCYFYKKLIIFNEIDERGYVAKGFYVRPPASSGLSTTCLNDMYRKMNGFLANIRQPVRCQINWNISSDYEIELENYKKATADKCKPGSLAELVRNERYERYRAYQDERALRRELLTVYFSIQLSEPVVNEEALELLNNQLGAYGSSLNSLFSQYNCEIDEMEERDYFERYVEAFSPGIPREIVKQLQHDPAKSALEQCVTGDIKDRDSYFFMSGRYHNIVAVKAAPSRLEPGMMERLMAIDLRDFSITVNLSPIDPIFERKKEEDLIRRIEGDMEAVKKSFYSLRVSRDKKVRKVEDLAEGRINPFKVEFVLKVTADSIPELNQRTNLVREAVSLTNGTLAWEFTDGRNARNLFFQTLPGWTFGSYNRFGFYASNEIAAAMLPFSSSFLGKLDHAEALYEGSGSNLVGVSTFTGGMPQHAVVLGTTGCGKSAFMIDLLAQTEPFYDFTCIIEEGLSYSIYSLAQGVKPLVIHPDSSITFNYLDIAGLPLTPSHISFCASLLMNMIGFSGDKDRDNHRHAMLSKYLQMQYKETYDTFIRENEGKDSELARLCAAVEKDMSPLDEFSESLIEFKKKIDEGEGDAISLLASISDEDTTRYLKSGATAQRVEQAAFMFMGRDRMPDHYTFVEFIRTMRLDEHAEADVQVICTGLEKWTRTGPYGSLFDGETNVDLNGRHVHFELGSIPESANELKNMVGFMILNVVRQHVLKMPRQLRKRVLFEESARFLTIDSGEKILSEYYAQMRKFNAWVCSINQNYTRFKQSNIKSVVMSNSKQFFLMRQNDKEDVEDFAATIDIPESSRDAVLSFPVPSSLPVGKRYSSFLYHYDDRNMFFGGVTHNVSSKEMLFLASTSAENFDDARKAVGNASKQGKTVMDVIREKAAS